MSFTLLLVFITIYLLFLNDTDTIIIMERREMLKKRLLLVMCLFVSLFLFNITNISAKEFEITNSYEFNENVDYGDFYGMVKNDATTFVVVGSNQQSDYNNKIAYGVIAKYNVNGEKI